MSIDKIIHEAEHRNPRYDYHKVLMDLFDTYKTTHYQTIKAVAMAEIEDVLNSMKYHNFSHECIRYYVSTFIELKYPKV